MIALSKTILQWCPHLSSCIASLTGVGRFYSRTTKAPFTGHGLMTAVFTPLNEDLTINYSVVPSYVKYVLDSGFKNVLVGGTTGEHQSLAVDDRKQFIKSWMDATKSTDLHIQAQIGGSPLPYVLQLAKYCQEIGVHSLLLAPELYFRPESVEDLVFYVSEVAKAAPKVPIVYYHSPNRSKVQINMTEFIPAATSSIPTFQGIKYADFNLAEVARIQRVLKDDQVLYIAQEALVAPAQFLGIKSSMCTAYSLFPQLAQDLQFAVDNSDIPSARDLQEKLSLAVEAITSQGPSIPAFKAAMELVTGIKVGPPSLPQRPISEEARQRMQTKLRTLGFCQ